MRFVCLLVVLASHLPGQNQQVSAALAAGSYFPLDVGDRWVYRIDNRFASAAYQTWRVDRTEALNGKNWSVIAIESAGTLLGEYWFRADESGRVYSYTGAEDQLFLDPTPQAAQAATLQIKSRNASYVSPLGTFRDALSYDNRIDSLILEGGTLVRGVGLMASQRNMLSGSSGGFFEGRTLVEASVGPGLHFAAPLASLRLSIESLTLDVSGKHVTNCAIPCYFVACYLIPGADPPDAYKPCAQTRVELENWPSNASRTVRLQLLASDGAVVYDQASTFKDAQDKSIFFVQVPLYSQQPILPFPPGGYRLIATTSDNTAQTVLAVQIQ